MQFKSIFKPYEIEKVHILLECAANVGKIVVLN